MARSYRRFRLGVQDDDILVRNQGKGREWGLDRAKRLGAKVVRANFTHGDKYDDYDALIAAARKRGIRVQLTLMGTPAYHDQKGKKISATRANPKEVGKWAGETAKHFKGRVGRYSIWNEPNHPLFMKNPSAAQYAKVYKRAHRGIKKVDRKAQVMVGELAPGKSAKHFVNVLGRRGITSDGLAMHPYQDPGVRPTARHPARGEYGISNVKALQKDLRKHKKGLHTKRGKALPVYLTEFGYQANVPNRGSLLRSAVRQAKRSGARQLVLYQILRADPHESWDTGLYERSGKPTEAARALLTHASKKRG